MEAMRPVSSCTADSRPRCSPSRTCSVSSSVESPAPHIICRCAPASLAPDNGGGVGDEVGDLGTVVVRERLGHHARSEVVLEDPVGEHVGWMTAPSRDNVGEGRPEEALLSGTHRREPHPVEAVHGKDREAVTDLVPIGAGLRAPRLVGELPALLVGRQLDEPAPCGNCDERRCLVEADVQVEGSWGHLRVDGQPSACSRCACSIKRSAREGSRLFCASWFQVHATPRGPHQRATRSMSSS